MLYPITLTTKLDDVEICGLKLGDLDHPDFEFPWELIDWGRQTIVQSLKLKVKSCSSKFKVYGYQADVLIGAGVKIPEFVAFNAAGGPIIIDDNVTIEPFVYIEGPCYIGQNCTIKSHAQIRHATSIGHDCKIGGEVSSSIIQPYTNKAHHGFIGDSYIGSWVNLGAGTTCSNLKNTYGPVRVDYPLVGYGPPVRTREDALSDEKGADMRSAPNEKIDTGLQFLGCMLGDYVKTAINTSIFTGKIIGVGAQLMGIVTDNVGSFVMMTPDGPEEFELEAAIRSQKRMFERRGVKQGDEDVEMLKRVFEETKGGRRNF